MTDKPTNRKPQSVKLDNGTALIRHDGTFLIESPNYPRPYMPEKADWESIVSTLCTQAAEIERFKTDRNEADLLVRKGHKDGWEGREPLAGANAPYRSAFDFAVDVKRDVDLSLAQHGRDAVEITELKKRVSELLEPARAALLAEMLQFSEDNWAAGWYSGLEFILWNACESLPNVEPRWQGNYDLSALERIKALSVACGGWWIYAADEEVFVDLELWQRMLSDKRGLAELNPADKEEER